MENLKEEKEKQWAEAYKKACERIFAGLASMGEYKYVQNYQDYMHCDWNPGWEPDLSLLNE